MFYAHFDTVATKKRLGPYSGNKATYSNVAQNIFGFFKPISSSQATLALGIMGQAYEYTVHVDEDIRVGDILTIDSDEYKVRGVSKYKLGGIDFRKCVLDITTKE